MKTYRHLFEQVTSFENLILAAERAAHGKGSKYTINQFFYRLEDNILQLQDELLSKTYRPGPYRSFYITDPKPRFISAAPFRDRVVHHALCRIIEPLFDKTFIFDTYANRIGKGTHAAIRRAQSFFRTCRYVLKCDIQKYFASIDHGILKQSIRWRIADPDVLWLTDLIIDASNEQEHIYELFPGDDLLTPVERRHGLPLGNLTSQFFANLYLNSFDHFVKEQLGAQYYIRYVDDFVIASNDKSFLYYCKKQSENYMQRLRLKLHPRKCHVLQSSKGVPFLGQVIYHDYRLLKKDNVRRFTQRLKKRHHQVCAGDITQEEFDAGLAGWLGHAAQANTWRLRQGLEKKFEYAGVKLT